MHRKAPIKTLCATGSQSAVLMLPPGRHCFRLVIESPIVAVVNAYASGVRQENSTFVLGPEEVILAEMVKQPAQWLDSGKRLMGAFSEAVKGYISNAESYQYNTEMAAVYSVLYNLFEGSPKRLIDAVSA